MGEGTCQFEKPASVIFSMNKFFCFLFSQNMVKSNHFPLPCFMELVSVQDDSDSVRSMSTFTESSSPPYAVSGTWE